MLLVIASLVPVALGTLSWIYAIAAVAARRALHLARRPAAARPDDRATARRTFLYSLLYLALLFVAMGVDSALLAIAAQAARRSSTVTMPEASSRIETGVTAVSSPNSGSRLE